MKLPYIVVVTIGVFCASFASAECGVNSCKYASGCYSEHAILCQEGQRMECKGASWGPSDSPEGACSPGLTRLMIIEMTVTGQNPAEPGKGGAEGFPPKVWEDTLVRPVATLCDYQERCSFVPRSLVGVPNPFTVLRLRYACRNIVSGAMKLFGPQPPNGGDANAVYTLDCVGL